MAIVSEAGARLRPSSVRSMDSSGQPSSSAASLKRLDFASCAALVTASLAIRVLRLAPEPESKPDPQPVIPSEKENVGMLGNLIDNAGWILPTLGVAIPGGALGWLGLQGVLSLFGRRRRRKEGGDDNIPPLFRRDVSEAEQIIGLRQSEQREPIFDTMRGILFEDEFNSNPDQSFKEAVATVDSKFNKIVPVSTQHTRVDTK